MSKKEKEKQAYTTQQILIKKGHRMYPYFEQMCQNAKNMYNTTLFFIRQVYTGLKIEKSLYPLQQEVLDTIKDNLGQMNDIQQAAYQKRLEKEKAKPEEKRKKIKCHLLEKPTKDHPYVDYHFLDSLFKTIGQVDYRSLPAQSSQGVMKIVFQNWKSFYESLKDYRVHPHKYKGVPRILRYSRASQKEVVFTNQDCVVRDEKFLKFPKTKLQLNIGKLGVRGKLKQVRVIPQYGHYVVELVMDDPHSSEPMRYPEDHLMTIDLGIDNLATIVTNTRHRPVLFKGKHVQSINQYYNKKKAHYISILRQGKKPNEGPFTSRRLEKLHDIRHRKLKAIFHKVSHHIVKIASEEKIGTIVIGQNKDWKQEVNMGKRNNQSFVHIPHRLLITMITYKAQRYGIQVMVTEESYTSKASFIDGDDIPTYGQVSECPVFLGKRGLYRSKHGWLVNADVNGAANILKKTWEKLWKNDPFPIESVLVWGPEQKGC